MVEKKTSGKAREIEPETRISIQTSGPGQVTVTVGREPVISRKVRVITFVGAMIVAVAFAFLKDNPQEVDVVIRLLQGLFGLH